MNLRTIDQLIQAQAISEGAGVTVHRTIGTKALRHCDPFLMLDHFGSDNPNEYIAGFPDHPHRGFITFTYMLDGHMLHQDSLGNQGHLRTGGAQWMKAARGVIHSEMPQQSHGLMRGFQLWINLPSHEKMSKPEYQELSPQSIPTITTDDFEARVLSGAFAGHSGAIHDPHTHVHYFDVRLRPEKEFSTLIPAEHTAFVYVYEGDAHIGNTPVPRHTLALLGHGDTFILKGGKNGARFIVVSGQPLGEPIVQYGPFVMNTRAEIEQAFADFQAGKFATIKAEMKEH